MYVRYIKTKLYDGILFPEWVHHIHFFQKWYPIMSRILSFRLSPFSSFELQVPQDHIRSLLVYIECPQFIFHFSIISILNFLLVGKYTAERQQLFLAQMLWNQRPRCLPQTMCTSSVMCYFLQTRPTIPGVLTMWCIASYLKSSLGIPFPCF